MKIDFRSWAKSSLLILAFSLLASIGLFWIMPLLGIGGLVLTFLILVARLDNESGTFLPLAVLFVLVLLVMTLLLVALAYVHALMSGAR